MEYWKLLKKANKKVKELNILNSVWFDKKILTHLGWRTRMYGYASFRRSQLEKIDPLEAEEFIRYSRNHDNRKQVWLYVHVPFCIKKCPFCFYHVVPNPQNLIVNKYVSALKKHLNMWIKLVPDKLDVVAIHFGGGTPTYLNVPQLRNLLSYINRRLNIKPNIFYTFESSPETIVCKGGDKKLKELLNNGVNRLSIGIQSFDDTVLKISKRGYDVEDAISSVKLAREKGFKNINIDLLLGLPGETTRTWYNTLKVVKKLKPESVSLYHLRRSCMVSPFLIKSRSVRKFGGKKPDLFPGVEDTLTMNLMLSEVMSELNYTRNRPCSFTRSPKYFWYPGDVDILPLGMSAWSFYNNYHIFNACGIDSYLDLINRGILPLAPIGKKLSKELILKKEFVTRIQFLNWGGLNKNEFKKKFSLLPEEVFGKVLAKLKKEGMIEDKKGYLKLSFKGTVCVDSIVKYVYNSKLPQM